MTTPVSDTDFLDDSELADSVDASAPAAQYEEPNEPVLQQYDDALAATEPVFEQTNDQAEIAHLHERIDQLILRVDGLQKELSDRKNSEKKLRSQLDKMNPVVRHFELFIRPTVVEGKKSKPRSPRSKKAAPQEEPAYDESVPELELVPVSEEEADTEFVRSRGEPILDEAPALLLAEEAELDTLDDLEVERALARTKSRAGKKNNNKKASAPRSRKSTKKSSRAPLATPAAPLEADDGGDADEEDDYDYVDEDQA